MSFQNEQEHILLQNWNLLCQLLSPVSTDGRRPAVDLHSLEKIIEKDIPEALNKNAPPDYYELYTDFKAEYGKLRDYILYDRLIGKNVVALGGGFSSGKSTFLNTLIGIDILPMDSTPTTSVPTYMIHDPQDNSVEAINIFDVKVQFEQLGDIQSVSHDFGKLTEDGVVLSQGTPLGHILKNIFVATPEQTYANIAFLDTPGYSKADSKDYSARTDEQIARQQLNTANLILWFIHSGRGDITKNDIEFLQQLRPDIPFAVILTRADQKREDLKAIKKQIKSSLTQNGLNTNCQGVFACDSDEPDGFDMAQIRELLSNWDRAAAETDFSINFKRLFIRCRKYCEDMIYQSRWKLEQVRAAQMRLDSGTEAQHALKQLEDDLKRENNTFQKVLDDVMKLQKEFFQELKLVGDQVHIPMPEPDDAVLWKESSTDPLELLREYNKKKGRKVDHRVSSILQDALGDIEPQFNKLAGGSEYRNKVLKVLQTSLGEIEPRFDQLAGGSGFLNQLLNVTREHCQLNAEEIHFNDTYPRK